MTDREKLAEKVKFMKEKYADVINDLSVKYGVDAGVAYYKFLSIPRSMMVGETPDCSTDIAINYEELMDEYVEYLGICKKVL